jgi:hypothetical protein
LVGLEEKLGTNPQIDQLRVLWIVSEAIYLRSSEIHPNLSAAHKRLLYMDHVRYIWSRVIRRSSVENVWRVGKVFPCRMYTDLNLRDSWI